MTFYTFTQLYGLYHFIVVSLFRKFSTTRGVNWEEYMVITTMVVEKVKVEIVINAEAIIPSTSRAKREVV